MRIPTMDIEFHYHVTAIVARHAGFSEAEAATIGHGAQFVDDNTTPRVVLDAGGRAVFRSLPTQARGFLAPWTSMPAVFPAFHFVPGREGDARARADGATHPLVTTPDSPGARALLAAAFHAEPDTRLMRIAIASHTYADTWAHQGFAGLRHPINALGRGLLPTLGHIAALARPDRVGLCWTDPRLVEPKVDNGARFIAAARALHARYREHLKTRKAPRWEDLAGPLAEILQPDRAGAARGRSARCAAYAHLAPWLPPYDAQAWEREALAPWEEVLLDRDLADTPRLAPAPLVRLFAWRVAQPGRTAWHRFQEAAHDHLRLGLRMFAPLLTEAGVATELPDLTPDIAPAAAAVVPEPGLDLTDFLAAHDDGEGPADAPDAEPLSPAGALS
jgi:Family of unknown function (DUF6765)